MMIQGMQKKLLLAEALISIKFLGHHILFNDFFTQAFKATPSSQLFNSFSKFLLIMLALCLNDALVI